MDSRNNSSSDEEEQNIPGILQAPDIPEAFHRISDLSDSHINTTVNLRDTSTSSRNSINPEHMNRLRQLLNRIEEFGIFEENSNNNF